MKKIYRRGSKIVDIVKRNFKRLEKDTKDAGQIQIPDSTSEILDSHQVIDDIDRILEPCTSSEICFNDENELFETAQDIACNVVIFQNQASTSADYKHRDYEQESTLDYAQPSTSTSFLNEDLYLTDSSEEYFPDHETSTSSSNFSNNTIKPSEKSTSTCKKTRMNKIKKDLIKRYSEADTRNISGEGSTIFDQLKRKRRQAAPSQWKKNIRKNKRQHGEPYLSAKGILIPGKRLKESQCMGRCAHLCTRKFSEEDRLKIFSLFWNIDNVEQKRLFIANLIERQHTKTFGIKESRKKYTSCYFLEKVGSTEKIRVCQKFFVSTLNVSETFVRTCFKKVIDNDLVIGDRRGKHPPHNKKSIEIREHVKNHIKSFPRIVPPPRIQKNSNKEYLARNLNLAKMYRLYKMKCEKEKRECVELAYYRSVFNKDFNIGFHRPGRDICEVCCNLEHLFHGKQKRIHSKHLKRIAAARQHNEDAKRLAEIGEIHFAEYDMKAITERPPFSSKHKHGVPVFNFTVLDFNKENLNIFCYCWHEGMAKRGATEVGSCLYKYLQRIADGKPITFMSDACASQCRNMYISSLLLYCIETFDIPEINQKFFEQGHSQLLTDDIHAIIEKAKKKVTIRGPSDIYNIIRNSLWKYPHNVYEMCEDDFIDLKYLKNILIKNAKIDQRGESVNWYNIRWLQYRKENPNYIYFKYELDDKEFDKMKVIRRGKRPENCKDIILLKKYYL